LPTGGVETLESNFPNFFLKGNLINLFTPGWNINSSQIVAQVVDQFKGQLTKGKYSGTEIICLVSSLS